MPDDLPTPPVPADCDLRGMPGFMLDTERLMASELWALSDGQAFKAAMALWCRSWRQVPAASLPDDDAVLRTWAGLTASAWKRCRSMALRGFIKCSDGRLYHKVLAEDAARAWGHRQSQRDRAMKRWGNAGDMPRHSHGNATASIRQSQGQGQGQDNTNTPPPSLESLPRAHATPPRSAATTVDLGDLVSPIEARPTMPNRTLGDFQVMHSALLVTRDDRQRADTILRLYGWELVSQAVGALASERANAPQGKRKVFVGEVSDWLDERYTPDPEDYIRAGLTPPVGAAP